MNLKEMEDKWQELRSQIDAFESEWWEINREKNKRIEEVESEFRLKFIEHEEKKKALCSEANELYDEIERLRRNRNDEQRRNVWFA